MVFLIFLFFFLFPHSVLAESSVKITDFSSDSSIEWLQLTNLTSSSIDLSGWYFKDLAGTVKTISNTCISANSTQSFEYSSYLNNGGDTVYFYNKNSELIDTLTYTSGVDKDKTIDTNTCAIPTNTPTPTLTPTNTPTPTATPTPDPTIINPTSGISLTEFMPYTDPEWIEIYNANDYPVKLVSWKIEDNNGNIKNIDSLSISAKSYGVYELKSLIFDNNNADKIILRDQNSNLIKEFSYSNGLMTADRSWSLVSGSWCQSNITKGYENVTSCYSAPTPTVIPPTATPTLDSTKYTPDESATESAIIEPVSNSSILTLKPTLTPTPTPSSGSILGNDTSTSSSKKKYLPLILILSGGLLLASPAIFSKIKPKK